MKRAMIALSVALICAVSAPWGAQQAHAASAYDDSYKTTDALTLGASGCENVDISLDWATKFQESSRFNPGAYDSFATALESGRWGVSQLNSGDTKMVRVFWTEDTSLSLSWSTTGVHVTGTEIHVADMWLMNHSGYITCDAPNIYGYETSAGTTIISDSSEAWTNYFVYTDNLNLPEGYDGLDVRTEAPAPPTEYAPTWSVNVTAFRGEFSDSNFFTFDNTPFLCDGGLAPVINWEFYDSSDTLIDSGTNSATALFNYTFEAGTYTLRGIYDCGEGDSNTFSNYGEREFTITAQGGLESSDFYACLTDEFPFVDVPACLDNVFIFTQMLLFGKASFGSYFWDAPDDAGCGTLAVLDNWIHVDNPYVCPMFPAGVRATITPFATFGLSLMLFRVVLGRIHNRGLD